MVEIRTSKRTDKNVTNALFETTQRVYIHNILTFVVMKTNRTRYMSIISEFLEMSTSIIQGTGIGPVSYVVNASDLFVEQTF